MGRGLRARARQQGLLGGRSPPRLAPLRLILGVGLSGPRRPSRRPCRSSPCPSPATPSPRAALGAIERCGERGSTSVVAPVLAVDFGDAGTTPSISTRWTRVLRDLPASRSAAAAPARPASRCRPRADETRATALEERVAQVVAALPLESGSVGGVILEIAPSPGDLAALQFTLARLVLQLKAAKPSLGTVAVVFPPGLVRQEQALARRVAAYADLIGVGYGTEWRGDAEWVRDELGKPRRPRGSGRAPWPEPKASRRPTSTWSPRPATR